jgi:hypothetical protein
LHNLNYILKEVDSNNVEFDSNWLSIIGLNILKGIPLTAGEYKIRFYATDGY